MTPSFGGTLIATAFRFANHLSLGHVSVHTHNRVKNSILRVRQHARASEREKPEREIGLCGREA